MAPALGWMRVPVRSLDSTVLWMSEAVAVEDGGGGAFGALEGDGLAVEVEVFRVGAGGDEEGVAWVCGVDGGLDGGLVGRDVDGLLGTRHACQKQEGDCHEEAVERILEEVAQGSPEGRGDVAAGDLIGGVSRGMTGIECTKVTSGEGFRAQPMG